MQQGFLSVVVTETMLSSVIEMPQINHYPATDISLEIDVIRMKCYSGPEN
jgi:hypothetical protein